MKKLIAILTLVLAAQQTIAAPNAPKKVLVVVSSESKITLRDGVVHPTGYFLSELMVPVMAMVKAGFEPVFANPQGNQPSMDKISDTAFWFGGNEVKFNEVKKQLGQLQGFNHPLTLKQVRQGGLSQYAGIFIPGGHAPMEDLLRDPNLGAILRYFHEVKKPTALICHGPIALLSALANPDSYLNVLREKSSLEAQVQSLRLQAQGTALRLKEIYQRITAIDGQLESASKDWIYKDYVMTAFSSKEEEQEEITGEAGVLGGFVQFYPDEALGFAGGKAVVNSTKWKSNVQLDRELITGQNPFSDVDLAKALVSALTK